MNKTELIAAISEKADLPKKVSEKAWNAAVEVISEELKKGEKIQLAGFGSFEVKKRAARTGRNPQKPGESIDIPAKNLPAFKASKTLKDIVQ